MAEILTKPNILCNIHKEEITEIRKQISDMSKDITDVKVKIEGTNRLERMVEKVTESVDKLMIKTTEHEEALKRLDKIDTRLGKIEYYMWWALGGITAVGGGSVLKLLLDIMYNSSHHVVV